MPMKENISSGFIKSQDSRVHVNKKIRRVAIIGGGASGAITLDTLLRENTFDNITVFERKSKLGGVWVLDENIKTPNDIIQAGKTSKQTDPQLNNPFQQSRVLEDHMILDKNSQERFIETPSYKNLKTNILEKLMTFSDLNQWLPNSNGMENNKYVDREIVTSYIDSYLRRNLNDDRALLRLNTTVEDVIRIRNIEDDNYHFELTLRKPWSRAKDFWWRERFDAIVISTGHYNIPFIPSVPGLLELQKKFPGVVEHAKFFRSSSPYTNKRVIVVGSRASGSDLTKFISKQAKIVYQSVRNFNTLTKVSEKVNLQPTIKEILIIDEKNFKVIFENGVQIHNPDHLIYATGYQFSYPFLNKLFNTDGHEVTEDGIIVPHLYQHTFSVHEPLIAFVGIPIDGISFRVFEYQAILVSRYLAGKIRLPSRDEQNNWIIKRRKNKGLTRAYHSIGSSDVLNYIKELVELGKIEEKHSIGREFPILTPDDIETYIEAGAQLRKFWGEI